MGRSPPRRRPRGTLAERMSLSIPLLDQEEKAWLREKKELLSRLSAEIALRFLFPPILFFTSFFFFFFFFFFFLVVYFIFCQK